ncbi:MAG: anthranilate synthase component I [Myxococcota bacterium]
MVRPDCSRFRALARDGRAVPLVLEVLVDFDTPLGIFRKLDDGVDSFLYESVEPDETWGRFSFVGAGARARFEARGPRVEIERSGVRRRIALPPDRSQDPLDLLRGLLADLAPVEIDGVPSFSGGAVGYLAYDWVRYVERLPEENPDVLGLPDCRFVFPEVLAVHDRRTQRLTLILPVEPGSDPDAAWREGRDRIAEPREAEPEPPRCAEPMKVSSNLTREAFHRIVERARAYIRAGDVFQVVPSQRLELEVDVDPFQIYRALRILNPSPYLFFLRGGDHVVLGSSPEILVRLEAGEITLRPIAGTRPRGRDEAEDRRHEAELLADPKELAEHLMLVDLGRNDVGRVAQVGSVRVDEFQSVERYSHVMHLVSNVRARLRADRDAIDLLRATFPAGTLTGAPKVRAMEIIEELEPSRRGLYGGCVGYLDHRGNMDTCIAIRTLVARDGRLFVQAGGGIVADSVPEREYRETLDKARALLRAIERAGGGVLE